MKKITTPIVTLLLACIFNCPLLKAQTVFSTSNLAIFYPNGYDSTQTNPSFVIQNEPVVSPGVPTGWKLTPSFYLNTSNNNCASVNCGTGTDFYGTGEVTGNLRRNNTSITLWNTDNFNYASDGGQQLYQSHPWVMGVRADGTAFGVIADNTWQMTIAISDTNIVFTSQGPSFRVLTFEAASPQQAVEELAALTGKISLPPIWSLGYHQCRYSYTPDTQVEGVADTFRLKQLPCDAVWMDIDYMNQYEIFTFSPTAYPNPSALNTYLHNKNFKSVWMIDPGVKQLTGYSIYDQGTAGNYWVKTNTNTDYVGTVWPGNCVFPDFTMPATRTWWSGLYSSFMANGVDGVWNDMNEPSVFNGPGGTMPITNVHRGGGTLPSGSHLRYHNVFGRLMVQASRAGIMAANPTKRPFILSRSNFLGGQQYAATWTGDNDATTAFMQLSVPMILTMGLSGQPIIGADVTGYSGSPSATLVGQWMALGTFYPFYRNHSEKGTPRREPWAYGAAIEQVSRIALQRRYCLLPYIYTLTQESTTDGLPIMRPLFFAEPGNAALRSQQQAFLLGDILMIIPKWATGVNYPSGVWTSISLVGEDSKNDPYQPDIRIKAGTILPLGQIIQNTANYNADSLSLIVSLDANNMAKGIVYTDSGEGYSYQSGAYTMREFNIQPLGTDSLILTATVDSGHLSTATNRYRVGIVNSTGITYTGWTNSTVIKIPLSITGESPYGGTPWPIPGTIQAENYDLGGEGIAYHDNDTINQGGQYRTTEGVDVETCLDAGGGYDVGYTNSGEWEKYTVMVNTTSTYTLQARVASITTGNSLHVAIDGVTIGTIAVPNTGGFQTWQTVNVPTPTLSAGQHTMLIYMETGNFNLNYVTFVLPTATPLITSAPSVSDIVGTAFSGYTITATNSPTSYSFTGTLPAGLLYAAGSITGTPTVTGTFIDTVKATNASGTGTQVLTITINPVPPPIPVVTSVSAASGTTGAAFSPYTIVASNTPTLYAVTGTLPAGLALSGNVISGTPTVAGVFVDTLKATNAGGTGTQVITITINSITAVCSIATIVNATSAPVIDGTVDAVWANAPTNAITKTISGTIQTGSTWQAMYDSTNLYVLVKVKDANLSSVGTNVYDEDGVELFLSGNNSKAGAYTTNDHQYRFNWNVAATIANITGNTGATAGITYAIPASAGGYTLEVSIPWTTIGGGPVYSGKQIGFDININDQQNNAGARDATEGWNGTATDDFQNTADFGTVNVTVCSSTAPVITSAITASTIINTAFSYNITATNTPTGYSIGGTLPAGLSLSGSIISGTPTVSGTFIDTVKATNAGGTGTQVIIITILPNKPVITSGTTINGTINTAIVSYTITATNTPTSYSIGGTLPAGLSLSGAVISGTPTVSGTFIDTVKATNAGGTGTQVLTITILPNKPVITSGTTINGTINTAIVSYTITATNTPTSYSIGGTLPAGLSLSGAVISGTPAVSGTFIDTVKATNAGGTGTQVITITILPNKPVITSGTTINGTINTAIVSYTITATNTPTSYSIGGTLPAGLSLSGAVISGTPTVSGTFIDTVKATNAGGTGTQVLTITILPNKPVITSGTTINGTINTAIVGYTITATNTPTSYSIGGTLPAGLSLSGAVISGTPTVSGTFIDTVKATNAGGTGTQVLTITILPNKPVITSGTTINGTINTAIVSYTITATNTPTSYSIGGTLPAGLSLSGAVISGTPTVSGTSIDTVKATNAGGTGTQVLTITINPAIPGVPVITSGTTINGSINAAIVNYIITATNSPTSYTITGILPTGLSLSGATISGTPTVSGTFIDTVKATNAGGTGTQIVTITILPNAPVITSGTTMSGTVNTAIVSYTITATNIPTSYTVTGTLPTGLSLSGAVISGTPTVSGTFIDTVKATNAGGTGTQIITITILPNAPVITSSITINGTVNTAIVSYTITATNSPISYAVTGTLPAGLSLSGAVISGTPTVSGTFVDTVKATNAGGTGTQIVTITILPNAPVITSSITINGTVNTAIVSYTITATNIPISYAVTGTLPAGLSLSGAVISGTPTVSGTFIDTVKATNAGGTGTQILTITISTPIPVVSSPSTASGIVGTAFTPYTIIASNTPTSYAATGLPGGLTINSSTGVISGTPTTQGIFIDTIKATNAGGTGIEQVTITINSSTLTAPYITNTGNVNATIGTTFNYNIIATNYPTDYSATNLPPGLSLDTITGLISGLPTVTGTYIDTIKATNSSGTGTQVIIITVAGNIDPPTNVMLLPNPVTQGHFIITLPGWNGEIVHVEIRNFLGALLQTNTIAVVNNMITIYVPNLIAGNYVSIITSDDKKIIKKFIVK